MATTRIMSLYVNKGKTAKQSLKERLDYVLNPDKTDNYCYVKGFKCDPEVAVSQFISYRNIYKYRTERNYDGDILAYHLRQSFKPGEISPDEANALGYELASRLLKGKYAFLVCTHTDKEHIHNHIMICPYSFDGKTKFRDSYYISKDIAKLSDSISETHQKSVIENPQKGNNVYSNWIGFKGKPSNRDLLREDIDNTMKQNPKDIDELLKMLEAIGYSVNYGKHISLKHITQKKAMRLDSLGEGYTEADLKSSLSGKTEHRITTMNPLKTNSSLLIDIHRKMAEGKGAGYEHWAKIFNLKQMANTVAYLQEHDFKDYDSLIEKMNSVDSQLSDLQSKVSECDKRMKELSELRQHILNYAKNSKIFAEYKNRKYDRRYFEEHKDEISKFKEAKKFFDTQNFENHKLPTVKQIEEEFNSVLSEKRKISEELKKLKAESRELNIHRYNIEEILGINTEAEIEKSRESAVQKE